MDKLSDIKIEKKIPVPVVPGNAKYPWDLMEVGDSFLCPAGKESSMRSNVSAAGKKLKRKYIGRKTDEGYRVWRIK